MAGSRLERIGTIYSRVTGLLRSGVLKDDDKPIWYNIYKAFPPITEPTYKREVSEKEILPIFYPEDRLRAKFYRKYGSPGIIDMRNTGSPQLSELYIQTYQELKMKGNVNNLEQATEAALLEKGIRLHGIGKREKENISSDKTDFQISNPEEQFSSKEEKFSSNKQFSSSTVKVESFEENYNINYTAVNKTFKLPSISSEFKAAKAQESILNTDLLNTNDKRDIQINDDALKFIKSTTTDKSERSVKQTAEKVLEDKTE